MKQLMMASVAWLVCMLPASAAEMPAALMQPYLKMHLLLTADKTEGLAPAASAIQAAAAALGKDAESMVEPAKRLGAAKTLEAARAAFGELSVALVAYSDKTNHTLPADLHIAYCPMVDKPWVQQGKLIQNPYYGTEMISCGSIKK